MFRIRFKDFSGCEHEYNYSSTNSIEEMKEEYNRICQIEGNTDVNIYEVEEHNITITMLNPKSRFTPIKEKISKIRQVLSYVHSVAMPYGLSLVKGKVILTQMVIMFLRKKMTNLQSKLILEIIQKMDNNIRVAEEMIEKFTSVKEDLLKEKQAFMEQLVANDEKI